MSATLCTAGLELTFSLKDDPPRLGSMKNHDQLHIIKVSGTDHCGNSGYIHQGFPRAWAYTN